MWMDMNDVIAKQHIELRNQLRKQFEHEQGSDADLLYESAKLFKPITESTEKIHKSLQQQQQQPPPQPEASAAAVEPKEEEYALIDPDYGLDIEVLEEMGFIRPSKLKNINEYDDIIDKVNYYNKYTLGRAKRGSTSEERADLSEKINVNREYVKRLRLLMSGEKLLIGKGLPPPPLKLVGNKFGNLNIDRGELELGRLKATKNGEIVLDEAADRSLYNLLTKRFCKNKPYTMNAIDIFKKLIKLAEIPLQSSSRNCRKRDVILGGAVHYNDPNDLVNRLQLLVAGKKAGNTGLNNDISDIIDELLSKSYISQNLAIKLYNNLLI